MRKSRILTLGLAGALGVTGAAFAQEPESRNDPNKPAQSAPAEERFEGTVTRVDAEARRLQVTDINGNQKIVHYDETTAVSGELKEGARASFVCQEKDGRMLATSIRLSEAKGY